MKISKLLKMTAIGTLLIASLAGCGANSGNTNSADGGKSLSGSEITVISREANSGTRGAFDELMNIVVKDGDKTVDKLYPEAVLVDSTDAVTSKVEVDKYAIGYTSLGAVTDAVKAIKVDNIAATAENVKNGTYKISRPFVLAVPNNASDTAKDFIKYVTSADAQKTVSEKGYIPLDTTENYQVSGATGKLTLSGSTSVEKLIEKLKENYIALNPNVTIEITYSGSSAGIKDVTEGKVDLGMSSRALKQEEKATLTETVFAHDGIAVIVNKDNPVDGLTSDEINSIFTGETREWK